MNKRIGYNVKALVDKLFPCHVFKQILTEHDSEEHYREERAWYISYPELNRVRFYHSCFSDSQTLYSDEGEELHALSKNVNSDDPSIHRINKLRRISPKLVMIDEVYAEATPELIEWIHTYFVTDYMVDGETVDSILSAISRTFKIDYTVEFEGVWTPVSHDRGGWFHSSKSLQLSGKEIDTILDQIEDELLSKKVEAIFNHYGKKVHKE